MVIEDIHKYHHIGLPTPHIPGSALWSILPYFIPEQYFSTYLTAIETFSQMYVGHTMYLHSFVCMPIPISVVACQSMYETFLANMLWALFHIVEGVCFHFYFDHNPFESSIGISQMNVLQYGETPYYESDLPLYL